MAELKVGDVVRLKSGGPVMTVTHEPDDKGYVSCLWFDKDGKPQKYPFKPSTLIEAAQPLS